MPPYETPAVRDTVNQYKRLMALVRPYWGSLVRSVLLGLLIALVGMAPPYLSKLLIDEVYPSKDVMLMEVLVVGLLVIAFTVAAMEAIRTYFQHHVSGRLTNAATLLFFNHLQEGETLLEISEDNDWRAELLVAERDVSRVRVGDDVQVELKAFGRVNSPEIRGRVLTVGAEPSASAAQAGSRMFPVVVRLDPSDLAAVGAERLRRGYTAEAKIVTRSERMGVLIWEYLLRRGEAVRERTKRRVEQGAAKDPAP